MVSGLMKKKNRALLLFVAFSSSTSSSIMSYAHLDEEVNWEFVRCLPNGEVVSVDGTHLGHNLVRRKESALMIAFRPGHSSLHSGSIYSLTGKDPGTASILFVSLDTLPKTRRSIMV